MDGLEKVVAQINRDRETRDRRQTQVESNRQQRLALEACAGRLTDAVNTPLQSQRHRKAYMAALAEFVKLAKDSGRQENIARRVATFQGRTDEDGMAVGLLMLASEKNPFDKFEAFAQSFSDPRDLRRVCQKVVRDADAISFEDPRAWPPALPEQLAAPTAEAITPRQVDASLGNNAGTAPAAGSGQPDSGWHIGPGCFWFRKRRFPLAGKPLKILGVFIKSHKDHIVELASFDEAWAVGDQGCTDEAKRTHISALRGHLVAALATFGIDIKDPLPVTRNAGWTFAPPRE